MLVVVVSSTMEIGISQMLLTVRRTGAVVKACAEVIRRRMAESFMMKGLFAGGKKSS